jgi:hypothetical protein
MLNQLKQKLVNYDKKLTIGLIGVFVILVILVIAVNSNIVVANVILSLLLAATVATGLYHQYLINKSPKLSSAQLANYTDEAVVSDDDIVSLKPISKD